MSETNTVFAVFYAIVFGGVLNRVGPLSAFWKDSPYECGRRWWGRVGLSFVFFTVLPAVHFAAFYYTVGQQPAPWFF